MTPSDRERATAPGLWGSVMLAATLAAAAAWLVGESGLLRVAPKTSDVMLMGVKLNDVTDATVRAAEVRSAAGNFAAFGGLLGLATGAACGLTRRASREAATAALVGLVAGAVAGGLAPVGVLPAYHSLVAQAVAEPVSSLVAHAGIWVPIGAAAGLAIGLGVGGGRRVPRAVAGAVSGAFLGAVAFDVIGALAFPLDATNLPVSTSATSRLVARLLLAVPASAAAVAAAGSGAAAVVQTPPGDVPAASG